MPINPELTDDTQDESGNSDQKNQISSGESVGVTPGSSSSSQAGGASKQGTPTSSGTFTNLNQYVNANKDQSAGLGSKIEQNVQGGANTALGQLSASGQEFNTKEQAAGVNPEDYSQEKIAATAQRALANPTDIGQSDIDKFNEARTKSAQFAAGTDTGPKALTELNSYQTAKNSLTNAAQNAGLTGTESGRDTLLKQTYAKPGYTQGQTNLDQLLTQNVQSNRDKFKDLQNNLLGQYGLASQDANAVQNAINERQKISTGTQQAGTNIQNVLLGTPNGEVSIPASNKLDLTPTGVAGIANTVLNSGHPVVIGQLQISPGVERDVKVVSENGKPVLYIGDNKVSNGGLDELQSLLPYYSQRTGFTLAEAAQTATAPQQGILTQYQTQLQARPGELIAQQSQNYNTAVTGLTNKIKAQLGDNPFGMSAESLAKDIINPASPWNTATLQNSFNPEDIARLNALNSLAGREAGTLGTTKLGPEDTNLFNPDITSNYAAGNQALSQQVARIGADLSNQAAQSVTQVGQPTMQYLYNMYMGSDQEGQNQGDRYPQVQEYQKESGDMAQKLANAIQNINTSRANYNLPSIQATPGDLQAAQQQAYNMLAYGAVGLNRKGGRSNPPAYNPNTDYTQMPSLDGSPAINYINARYNSSDTPYSTAYRAMFNNMVQINLYNDLLRNSQATPTYQFPGSTINQ